MSKGSRIIPVRMPDDDLDAMMTEIARYNANPLNEQITVSQYMRNAVCEKIAHSLRSRTKRMPAGVEKRLNQLAAEIKSELDARQGP